MNPAQVQYIRDRLADWEAVPEACRHTDSPGRPMGGVALFGGAPQRVPAIQVSTADGRELWSTDELVLIARHLGVLVDACEASLTKPPGDPDRAWAVAFLGSLALIWSGRPDYPKACHDNDRH